MIFTETKLQGAFIIDLEQRADERGFFARSFCAREFADHGMNPHVVNTNVSHSARRGTLRGMHFQRAPHAEAKLVRCTRGAIYDVIIDLRAGSPTLGQWLGVELTAANYRQLYVPEGFAHGFQTLEDEADVVYQVSEFYTPGAEGGLRYDDPAFGIRWPLPISVISPKDAAWPDFTREP
ncbi:dTDP-4-dehydrorhamnose 3,5-epimerase [Chloroflexia bacterium SDU3-3]|nr:dTDP-4-dehydrorhamnose 3,5-epimerase [Chloroflexia bacterium SDU3-3]